MGQEQRSHVEVPVHDLAGRPTGHDAVVVEEPLAIRVAGADGPGSPLATTMRTPGDDLSLAAGMAWSEALLDDPADLLDVSRCTDGVDVEAAAGHGTHPGTDREAAGRNDVLVRLRHVPDLGHLARHGTMTSACGICGRTQVDDLVATLPHESPAPVEVDPEVLRGLPDRLRAAQHVFGATGGLHAVARFDLDGDLLDVAEDVGRHNAFDKLVGRCVRRGSASFDAQVVLLSGRASYELLAKAARVRAPVVAAIGAPSSLAVEVARRAGITLVGFLRDGRGNVHSHPGRLRGLAPLPGTRP